ncbi:MAG: hypothetical protein V2I82_08995 [Halieaceae bacterium]|nr:hypothetical protein [Halieaceae bacterium]
MTAATWHKELTEYRRDRRRLALAIVLFALLLTAALDGWNRAEADAQARAAAEATDREVWTEQGENNPHGAAHFARYALRDTPALAAFDLTSSITPAPPSGWRRTRRIPRRCGARRTPPSGRLSRPCRQPG